MKSFITLLLILFSSVYFATAQKKFRIRLLKAEEAFSLDTLTMIVNSAPASSDFVLIEVFNGNKLEKSGFGAKNTISLIISTTSEKEFNNVIFSLSFGREYCGYFVFGNKTIIVSGDSDALLYFFSITNSEKPFNFKQPPTVAHPPRFVHITAGYLVSDGLYKRVLLYKGATVY